MKTIPSRSLFGHLLNITKRARVVISAAIISIGLIGSGKAASDFCQNTAQAALDGCQDAAESAHTVALGKCSNISNLLARNDCGNKPEQDFRDGLQTGHHVFRLVQ